ncbi:MAG: hypothetical protein NUV93_07150 [Firmicutes bacterium]|jgi:hypothetical protein|nr:hypothetical protein [Bacillota bacterium]
MAEPGDSSFLQDKTLAGAVENFRNLLVQGRRVFLIGAGCSKCAGLPLTSELTESVLSSEVLSAETREILAAVKDE